MKMKHPKIYLFPGDPDDPAEGFYIPEGYNEPNGGWAPIPLPAEYPSVAVNLARHLKNTSGDMEKLVTSLEETIVHELSHWAQ